MNDCPLCDLTDGAASDDLDEIKPPGRPLKYGNEPTVKISVCLPPWIDAEVRRNSQARGQSISEYVVACLLFAHHSWEEVDNALASETQKTG